MALLARVAVALALAVAAGGCYDPALRDCTVTCTSPSDCADGQTCGSAGLCIGSAETTCPGEAEHPDAAVPPTPSTVMLHVTVDGKGAVVVDGAPAMTCVVDGNMGDCMYEISANAPHHLVATPQPGRMFMMWMGACSGAATTCALTPTADTTVGATFQN